MNGHGCTCGVPHLPRWHRWQKIAKREHTRGRKRDPRHLRRMSWICLPTEWSSKPDGTGSWETYVRHLNNGRLADVSFMRLIQHVGLHDPVYGRVTLGGTPVRRADLRALLSRAYDRVSARTAARVWDSLIFARLLSVSCCKPCDKRCDTSCRFLDAQDLDLDLDVESKDLENPAVDSLSYANCESKEGPTGGERQGNGGVPERGSSEATSTAESTADGHQPCTECDAGRKPGGECCDCPAGRGRALVYSRCREDERAQQRRAEEALERRGDEWAPENLDLQQ